MLPCSNGPAPSISIPRFLVVALEEQNLSLASSAAIPVEHPESLASFSRFRPLSNSPDIASSSVSLLEILDSLEAG